MVVLLESLTFARHLIRPGFLPNNTQSVSCAQNCRYVSFKRKSLHSNYIVSKKFQGSPLPIFSSHLSYCWSPMVLYAGGEKWRTNCIQYAYIDTSTYHGKEYMKLQNGGHFCNSKMPQFAVCFNRLRKYFFCLWMEYLISKNDGYLILKYSSWLFGISQLYMVDWNDCPSHRIVWPMVGNHRKPSGLDGVGLKNHRKNIEHNGCPQPFHSMVMVVLKNCNGEINHICQI